MNLKVLAVILWTVAAVAVGLALWIRQKPSTPLQLSQPNPKAAASLEREAAGKRVPNFRLRTLEPFRDEWGDTLDYQEFTGKAPLVINFWASWCVPCREEAPLLEAAWQKRGERVQFIGINYRDQEEDALDFIAEFGQSFPSGADPRGDVGLEFGLFGIPTTYFVDPDGTIRSVKVGEISADELESKLEELVEANFQQR